MVGVYHKQRRVPICWRSHIIIAGRNKTFGANLIVRRAGGGRRARKRRRSGSFQAGSPPSGPRVRDRPPCRAVPCRAVPCRAVPSGPRVRDRPPCRAVPCPAVPCRAAPCRAAPRPPASRRRMDRSAPGPGSSLSRCRITHALYSCAGGRAAAAAATVAPGWTLLILCPPASRP